VTTQVLTLSGTRGGEVFTLDVSVEQPVTKPLMGASTTNDTTWASFNQPPTGPLQCRRSFYTTIPASPSTIVQGDAAAGRESHISFKPTVSSFNAGSLDTAYLDLLAQINHPCTVYLWHEPEDEVVGGSFTMAAWKAVQNRGGSLLHSLGKPNLKFGICLRGPYTFNPTGPYWQLDFWDPGFGANVDVIGYDPYNTTAGYGTLQNVMTVTKSGGVTNPMLWATDHGKGASVVLPEWGCWENEITVAQKATWITDGYAWMKAAGVKAAMYFHQNAVPEASNLLTGAALTAFQSACADARS
jgi:hypothetical protein